MKGTMTDPARALDGMMKRPVPPVLEYLATRADLLWHVRCAMCAVQCVLCILHNIM